jgi:hypothetical protein
MCEELGRTVEGTVCVAGNAVTVGVKKATHSRGAAQSQRQVAGAGNRQGGTHIRNILFSPGGAVPEGENEEDALAGRGMSNQTEGIPEILENIVSWHDGNPEFRKSATVGLLNA